MLLNPDQKILIVGAHGMVGQSLCRLFKLRGYKNLLTPTRAELDAASQKAVSDYMQKHRPDVVVISAAKVGGIMANSKYPASFLYENVMIASNLIHQAHLSDVKRVLYLGSNCIYPKHAPQPIREEALLTSTLEPTNEAYALAKIVGLKLCSFYKKEYGRDYITAMPTNLYGPCDSYHLENSHVIPGLIRRFHEAKERREEKVVIWGSGKPLREFLYVDDLAEALFVLLNWYHGETHINVGSDEEVTILQLAELIKETVGFEGVIENDLSKPDGTPRKKSDLTRIHALGWSAQTSLKEGLKKAYGSYQKELCLESALNAF
jgi:GDP-L-fucose synthase